MDALVSSALIIRLSLQPSPASDTSAFNNIRAFSSRCAALLPLRISASSCSRSSPPKTARIVPSASIALLHEATRLPMNAGQTDALVELVLDDTRVIVEFFSVLVEGERRHP